MRRARVGDIGGLMVSPIPRLPTLEMQHSCGPSTLWSYPLLLNLPHREIQGVGQPHYFWLASGHSLGRGHLPDPRCNDHGLGTRVRRVMGPRIGGHRYQISIWSPHAEVGGVPELLEQNGMPRPVGSRR